MSNEPIQARKARAALEALVDNHEWSRRRRLVLELVVAHVAQAGIPADADRKRFMDGLELHYSRVVNGLEGESPDLSYDPKKKIGVVKRYADQGENE